MASVLILSVLHLLDWALGQTVWATQYRWNGSISSFWLLSSILAPFISGLDMMGIRRALGSRVKANMVLDYLGKTPVLVFTAVLMNGLIGGVEEAMAYAGFPDLFSMLLGAILSISMMFVVPLILVRGLSPAYALLTSVQLFIRGWYQLLWLYAMLAALFVLAMLPLGLGLIWMMPFYLILNGLIYRDVCGFRVRVEWPPQEKASLDKGSFVA